MLVREVEETNDKPNSIGGVFKCSTGVENVKVNTTDRWEMMAPER